MKRFADDLPTLIDKQKGYLQGLTLWKEAQQQRDDHATNLDGNITRLRAEELDLTRLNQSLESAIRGSSTRLAETVLEARHTKRCVTNRYDQLTQVEARTDRAQKGRQTERKRLDAAKGTYISERRFPFPLMFLAGETMYCQEEMRFVCFVQR